MNDGRLELPAEFEQLLGDRLKAMGRGSIGDRNRARLFSRRSGRGPVVASILDPHPKHAEPLFEQ